MKLTRKKISMGISPVLIGILVGAVIINMLPRTATTVKESGQSKLVAVKKIFGVGEQPTLKLKLGAEKVGWWGAGTAEAAERMVTEVFYDSQKISIPVEVNPDPGRGYTLRLNPGEGIRPGSYTVTAKWGTGPDETATQTFAWGVLTINTTRPAYISGETAAIQMGVLSSKGNTLCGAPVTLKIYAPDGSSTMPVIHNSPVCNGDTYVTEPDYTAAYMVGALGHYRMVLRMADTDYEMEAGFEVRRTLPFVIERTAPTRLYPPATYTNEIKITPVGDFSGTVTEQLPAGFKIIDAFGATTVGTTLAWQVEMEGGKDYILRYSFKSPSASPAFYELSRLKFGIGNVVKYLEPRQWQMAGDTAISLLKQTVNNGTGTSLAITATSTTGNLLVVVAGLGSNTTAITSVTDTASNSWALASAGTGGSGTRSEIWYAQNATAVTSVTVNTASSINILVNLSEYRDVATSNVLDVATGQGNASSTSVPTATINTGQPGELLVVDASWTAVETVTSPGGAWTDLTAPTIMSNKSVRPAYQVAGAAGAYDATWTLSAATISSSNIAAFRPAGNVAGSGGGPCDPNPIAFVKQTAVNVTTATTSDSNRSLTSTAGNTLVMFYQINSLTARLSAITDNASNNWVFTATSPNQNPPQNASSTITGGIAYAINVAATTTITVDITSSQVFSYTVVEFSNIAASGVVDQSASSSAASSTSITTSSLTTTNANDLIVATMANTTDTGSINQGGSSPTSGWTQLTGNTGGSALGVADAAYVIVGATGTYSANFTMGAAHSASTGIIAFKRSASGQDVTMDMVMRGGTAFCSGVKSVNFWAR